jgi:ATP-dependent Lon protease
MGNVWGSGTLIRRQDTENPRDWNVWMVDFQPMQASYIDLDYFIDQRKFFSLEQWRELLVCSMGYNPEAYTPFQQQLLLGRLVPMVQPRVNLIELAPKGTGKSYIFSQLSRHSWLISGGVVTRPQLFYDMQVRVAGVITRYDTVILDEIRTINFTDPGEIVGALKGYLESGEFRVMQYHGTSDASFVLLANIPIRSDWTPRYTNYFFGLPKFLQESALIDRFHGLIPGWELPRIEKRHLHRGYSLKADYFSEVLHALRTRTEYMDYVMEHTQSDGDLRDVRSVQRIAAGFLRLLFLDLSLVTKEMFEKHCMEPAKQLRSLIRSQLHILDKEYSEQLATITVI